MTAAPVSFLTRLWLCWVCWFRVLFDGAFAARVLSAESGDDARAPDALAPAPEPKPAPAQREAEANLGVDGALSLLALFQREGRLLDFLQQDVTAFGDAEVGAAARVVHEGCRRALKAHAEVKSLRSEAEGARVSVTASEVRDVKLVGNVGGSAPYRGILRHRGWRIEALRLPSRVGDQDARVVAPAEVEL
ncbi:MAG TPA: DUF2760 domain-containing protein [Polyangiaceae bacterium]|nr:DUF2760 domain-containing protein [Polyangiaceae bacterium]